MRLHLNKPGIRVLGVAESFKPGSRYSVLAGVVMRRDLVIDGFVVGKTSVGGDDATSSIASLYRKLGRNDVNLVMVSGAVLSLYNIVDVDGLADRTKLPVICLTYKETKGIEESIRRHFPESAEKKLAAYRALGARRKVKLSSGRTVYIRTAGITDREASSVLGVFSFQGSVPEPARVARTLARAVASMRS